MLRAFGIVAAGAVGGLVLCAAVFYAWLCGCPGIDHEW